ncbi:ATP synthase epsilon chain OS=Streptomyces alboniger OX=132473 GN=atpC PE=3 SV=1 [Streptomyces alboniger]
MTTTVETAVATGRVAGCRSWASVTIRTSDGGTVVAAVARRFVSFADNKLSLLAEIAELSDEIDVQRVERELERAKAEGDASAERRADVRLRAAAAR